MWCHDFLLILPFAGIIIVCNKGGENNPCLSIRILSLWYNNKVWYKNKTCFKNVFHWDLFTYTGPDYNHQKCIHFRMNPLNGSLFFYGKINDIRIINAKQGFYLYIYFETVLVTVVSYWLETILKGSYNALLQSLDVVLGCTGASQ